MADPSQFAYTPPGQKTAYGPASRSASASTLQSDDDKIAQGRDSRRNYQADEDTSVRKVVVPDETTYDPGQTRG